MRSAKRPETTVTARSATRDLFCYPAFPTGIFSQNMIIYQVKGSTRPLAVDLNIQGEEKETRR